VESVYSAYNIATNHATHRMRSVRTAFELLERINRDFQQQFPARCQICENNKGGDESPRSVFPCARCGYALADRQLLFVERHDLSCVASLQRLVSGLQALA